MTFFSVSIKIKVLLNKPSLENIMKKFGALLLSSLMFTGCLSVQDNDKAFAITAKKLLIGKDFDDASKEIPSGATVLTVVHQEGPLGLGLMSMTYISGSK